MTGHRKILIVTHPGQGHVIPSLRFANCLIKMGVNVTVSTSLSAVRRFNNEATFPHGQITFAPFSDGHDNGKQPTTTLQQFFSDLATKGASAVAEFINSATAACQPFDHVVYTTAVPWAARVANAHRIKATLLWCQSAICFDIYYYYSSQYQDLMITNNDNPMFPINLPRLPPLTMADLPSFFLSSSPDEEDFILPLMKDHIDILKTAPRILINTFNELEIESLAAIEKIEFFPIGPLVPLEFLEDKDSSDSETLEDDSIQWLNTKPKSSVVYVSFGSIATLSMDQAEELAIGLLESRRSFLWVMRDSEQAQRLPNLEELKKQGMIVSWCCQVEVLRHHAIGCFVTHCGWNSTLEALVAGVPMVGFPQWTDQATNAKMIEDVWKTGVRMRRKEGNGMVEGKEIEKCVKMVMEDKEIKKNAEKWSEFAREALNNGGSSTVNLQSFLRDV